MFPQSHFFSGIVSARTLFRGTFSKEPCFHRDCISTRTPFRVTVSQEPCFHRDCISTRTPFRVTVSQEPCFHRDCISTRTPFRVTVSQEPCSHRDYIFKGIVSQKSLSRNLLFDSTTPFHSIKAPIWQPQQCLTVFFSTLSWFQKQPFYQLYLATILPNHNIFATSQPQNLNHYLTAVSCSLFEIV